MVTPTNNQHPSSRPPASKQSIEGVTPEIMPGYLPEEKKMLLDHVSGLNNSPVRITDPLKSASDKFKQGISDRYPRSSQAGNDVD